MSDAGTNFVSEKFRHFCKSINVEQAVSLAYHHQSKGQVKACIKFIKWTFKKCAESGRDKYIALLQVCTTHIGQGLPSLATIMFNRQVRGVMPVINWKPIGQDCDDDHHTKLVEWQRKNDWYITSIFKYSHMVSCSCSSPWTHGTVVGKGNHNHHDRSYVIQLTNNGRCISRNRWHIKPTTVTADAYLQHQSK